MVSFTAHFRPYLLGHRFTLRTDNAPLTWLYGVKEPEGQVARWLEQLQELDFKIIHRPGQRHQNADALSRLPCRQCGHMGEENKSNESATIATLDLTAFIICLCEHQREADGGPGAEAYHHCKTV